jgi:hypothetical protein
MAISHFLRCRKLRWLQFELLQPRDLFNVEGQAFNFNQTYDSSGLGGNVSGIVRWGDGTTSAATVGATPTSGPLRFRFDYTYDTQGFFASQERRSILEQVGSSLISKFSDQLNAITPTANDEWTARFSNPATGIRENRVNMNIAANELLVFVGSRVLDVNELGRGERGGFAARTTSQAFLDNVRARGQTGALASPATDFGPWGGVVTFSSTTNWHFGFTTDGLDANEFDFAGVAAHELMHVMGFGLSDSFAAKVSGGGFVGPNAVAVYGQSPVPMADNAHWQVGMIWNNQTVIMTPETNGGIRKVPTRLDLAGLQDLGWQLITPQVQVQASHVYGDNGSYPAILELSGSSFGRVSTPLSVNIANASPALAARTSQNATAGQPISIARIGQFTDAGFGSPNATPPRAESFTYSINWGDNSATDSGQAIVEVTGSEGVLTRGFFDGAHTYANEGSYIVTMVVTDDDGGSSQQQFTINVGTPPKIELSIDRSSIAEDAGSNAATLTIRTSGFDSTVPLLVSLTNGDSTELTIPASINMPVGQSSITVPIHAVDDTLLDGTIRVELSASVGVVVSNAASIDVLDRERILLLLDRASIVENAGAGAAVLTVSRSNTDTGSDMVVFLSSGDITEVGLPSQVIIPAGQSSANLGITAVDDALFDGTQTVELRGAASGYSDGTTSIQVTDYQPLSLALRANELIEEDPNRNSTQAEVTLRSPAPSGGITLDLRSNVPSQLIIPTSVFVPAGSSSANFPVTLADDFAPQGNRIGRISASGPGVTSASIDLALTDSDPAYWTNANNALDADGNGRVDLLDVLTIINDIGFRGLRTLNPNVDRDIAFVDVDRDGQLTPLDPLIVINFLERRI